MTCSLDFATLLGVNTFAKENFPMKMLDAAVFLLVLSSPQGTDLGEPGFQSIVFANSDTCKVVKFGEKK